MDTKHFPVTQIEPCYKNPVISTYYSIIQKAKFNYIGYI